MLIVTLDSLELLLLCDQRRLNLLQTILQLLWVELLACIEFLLVGTGSLKFFRRILNVILDVRHQALVLLEEHLVFFPQTISIIL